MKQSSERIRIIGITFLVLLFCNTLMAQIRNKPESKTAKTKSAVVSGRVFAILGNGDLKPARFAEVSVFYMGPPIGESEEAKTAGYVWIREQKKSSDLLNSDLKRKRFTPPGTTVPIIPSEREVCLRQLDTFYVANLNTLQWINENDARDHFDAVTADEDGVFNLKLPRPGRYVIVASGRAGLNEAVWVDYLNLPYGNSLIAKLKLASPRAACLATE